LSTCCDECGSLLKQSPREKQEAQLMVINPRDAFRG